MIDISNIWWGLPGASATFRAQLTTQIRRGVVLRLEDPIPFSDVLWEGIGQTLGCPVRTLEWTDRERWPGDFLLKQLFSPRIRAGYFPDDSYGTYLASLSHPTTVLRIRGVRGLEAIQGWMELVEDYRAAGGQDLILAVECEGNAGAGAMTHRTDRNQSRGFALLLSGLLSNTALPAYQAELAWSLCPGDPERCAELLLRGEQLLLDPTGTAATLGLDEDQTESAIQKADLVCLFPKIEQCRFSFLRKHRDILARYLPIRNIEGELIDDPMELEVTHVSYLIRNRPALQSLPGADLIILCANVRNQIAHNQPVPYATLLTLEHCI